MISNDKATLVLYSVYDARGCIQNGAIDETCVENNAEVTDAAFTKYLQDSVGLDHDILNNAIRTLEENCFKIAVSLGGNNG